MFSRLFWKDLTERSIATGAEVAAALFVIGETGLLDIDFKAAASVVGAAVLATALKGLAASRKGDSETASLAD